VKKGRHRRYEEARALKHTSDEFDEFFEDNEEPCEECAALPGHDHKSWCVLGKQLAQARLIAEDDEDEDLFPS